MTAAHNISLFNSNADMIAALVNDACIALDSPGQRALLLSGGSSPSEFYSELGRAKLSWEDIAVALVDERWVDEDDAGSNAALVKRTLLAGAAKAARFTPMKTSAPAPHQAANDLNTIYRGLPLPALTILGMGPDTHTASWFADAAEYETVSSADTGDMVAGLTAPRSAVTGDYLDRMTITGTMLALSRKAFLIIKGDSKIALLEDCLSSPSADSPIGRAAAILGPRMRIFALRGDG